MSSLTKKIGTVSTDMEGQRNDRVTSTASPAGATIRIPPLRGWWQQSYELAAQSQPGTEHVLVKAREIAMPQTRKGVGRQEIVEVGSAFNGSRVAIHGRWRCCAKQVAHNMPDCVLCKSYKNLLQRG